MKKFVSVEKNLAKRFLLNTLVSLNLQVYLGVQALMYAKQGLFDGRKTSLKKNYNDFPLIHPLDLETQLYQLLEALCMLIKLISLKKNLS